VSKKEEINNQVVVSAVRLIEKKTVKKGSMVLKFKDVSILKSNNVIPTADAATYLVKVYCDLRLNKECFYKPCRHVYMYPNAVLNFNMQFITDWQQKSLLYGALRTLINYIAFTIFQFRCGKI
jgi:hypothetical protein